MPPLPVHFFMLPPVPCAPLKGNGHKRNPFPFPLTNKQAKECWNAIPEAHKTEVATKNKGANFQWRRFVSPEVHRVLSESQKKF